MAGKKTGARKSAAKDKAPAPKAPKEPKAPKSPAQPTAADRKKQAELATPLEGVGPGVEHEDHEGGITDSLARKGVRGPLPTAEEREDLEAEAAKDGVVRAPSVRDRQTGMSAALARGGNPQGARPEVDEDGNRIPVPRGAAATLAARKGARIIPVVATRLGQYPADGRLRAPGEAFDYVMGEKEEKLPSWMQDARGELESREADETSPQFDETPAAVITVAKDGTVTSRNATVTEQNKVTGSKASVI